MMSKEGVGTDHCRVTPPGSGASTREQVEFFRHLFAYSEASRRICTEATVLEIGSGEGYGASYLALQGRSVVATDASLQSLRHLSEKYPGITRCCQASGSNLPFKGDTFDAVVSFQVIEHLSNPLRYLEEIRRVLKPLGTVLLTTPNRKLRLLPLQRPWNPYHVREYRAKELDRLLGRVFTRRHISGVMARPDIMLREKLRLSQKPMVVYGDAIKHLIRRAAPKWLVRPSRSIEQGLCERQVSARRSHPDEHLQIGPDDFFLSADRNGSLDLFAIATKE